MVTKKMGSTARFGPRYGTKAKKVIAAVEKKQRKKQSCPYCERAALKRLASGIWYCTKCKTKFAGGAYFPKTAAAKVGEKFV